LIHFYKRKHVRVQGVGADAPAVPQLGVQFPGWRQNVGEKELEQWN